MKIVNPAVLDDLAAGRGLRLNLGSGRRPVPGFYGVDRVPLPGVDVVADLDEPLADLPDNSVDEVYTRHALEHVSRLLELLAELHRVTRPGGRLEIVVPHFSNPYGYSDPTHVRFFGLYSFFYFCDPEDQPRRKVPAFYLPQRFRVESVRCRLLKASPADRLLAPLLQPLINRSVGWLDWYERRLCRWLPASEIRYVLRTKKGGANAAGGGADLPGKAVA
jgi:SAM-dependent methyltransferase